MDKNKLVEFITVLAFAVIIGLAVWLSALNLSGMPLVISVLVMTALAVILWQFLRKKFGRR
ncbi:MAG: hypothetical protein WCT06_07970 [Armatimonadota bacterium]